MGENEPQHLTRTEAAALLRVHEATLRLWERKGYRGVRLVPDRAGRRVLYSRALIKNWQEEVERAREKQKAVPGAATRRAEDRAARAFLRSQGVRC
jgi:hypothetical protein